LQRRRDGAAREMGSRSRSYRNANAKGEFYLTDAVTIADVMALEAVALEIGEDEVLGVDNREKLARGER